MAQKLTGVYEYRPKERGSKEIERKLKAYRITLKMTAVRDICKINENTPIEVIYEER